MKTGRQGIAQYTNRLMIIAAMMMMMMVVVKKQFQVQVLLGCSKLVLGLEQLCFPG